MTDDIYRTQLRLPIRVYERLRVAAEESGRSLNAEIAHRLDVSLTAKTIGTDASQPTERQKAELLLDFEAWLRESSTYQNEKTAYREYCRLYNGADPDWEQVEPVHGIEEVNPRFLRDLALAWRRYARESVYVQQFTDPTRPQRLAPERRKGELVMSYLGWCNALENDPLAPASLVEFCRQYNDGEGRKVLEMPEISPGYLEELMGVWLYNLPVQLAGTPGDRDFMHQALKAMQKHQEDKLKTIEAAMSRFADVDLGKM
ncbi:MAG: Arc family DNA-binding protein [Vogesella sp.]|uniref:Arc family DNA-binding protein n=1 Tax=Vogesella sp. TaxID=1904252 RepID=UPI00391A556C